MRANMKFIGHLFLRQLLSAKASPPNNRTYVSYIYIYIYIYMYTYIYIYICIGYALLCYSIVYCIIV